MVFSIIISIEDNTILEWIPNCWVMIDFDDNQQMMIIKLMC